MQVEQIIYDSSGRRNPAGAPILSNKAQFVLIFGNKEQLLQPHIYEELRQLYPAAYLLGGTTAGEIYEDMATDGTVSATAVYMERSEVRFASVAIEAGQYVQAAAALIDQLPTQGLRHVFVLSEGININGSKLADGLSHSLPEGVTLSGGLAGDGNNYQETFVLANARPQRDRLAAIGFYGAHIHFGYASQGGWSPFGIERLITRSQDNILYTFDDKPALALYRQYLGEYAEGLPAAGLYFPLMVRSPDYRHTFIRTIQRLNEDQDALVFSGDVPQGYYSKLMRSNFDRLIEGSREAARQSLEMIGGTAELAILVSCVGRKLVLDQLTSEEVEAGRRIMGKETIFTGFYSYGEILSQPASTDCELHNQTMTITVLREE